MFACGYILFVKDSIILHMALSNKYKLTASKCEANRKQTVHSVLGVLQITPAVVNTQANEMLLTRESLNKYNRFYWKEITLQRDGMDLKVTIP